jgi:hypothetical protein
MARNTRKEWVWADRQTDRHISQMATKEGRKGRRGCVQTDRLTDRRTAMTSHMARKGEKVCMWADRQTGGQAC